MSVFALAGRHAQTQSATITKGVGLVRGAGLPDCDVCEWHGVHAPLAVQELES